MNSAKRLAWRDPIADGDVHVDAGRLVVRRACEFCQPCDPAIVYNLNKSSPFGQKRSLLARCRRHAHSPLGFADPLEFRPRLTGIECVDGCRLSSALRGRACKLKQGAGKSDRPLSQVTWRIRLTSQDSKDIARFESGPDTPANGL